MAVRESYLLINNYPQRTLSMPDADSEARNAVDLLFGISFQINAGIMIMLRNIKEMETMRLEGPKEDIELTLRGGNKICAQAKSVVKANSDFTHILSYFDKSLDSLSEAESKYADKVNQLIYVTNSIRPIGSSDLYIHGDTFISYDDLPPQAKKKIEKRIQSKKVSISKEKLWIYHIPFFSNDLQERYKFIREAVERFIGSIPGAYSPGVADKLLTAWQKQVFDSGTITDTHLECNKEDIIWPLILIKIEGSLDEAFYKQFDSADLNELENRYGEVMSYKASRWSFITDVLSDYNDFSCSSGVIYSDKTLKFINENWQSYIDEISDVIKEVNVREIFLKILLYRVLRWRYTINDIKKSVNL